MLNTQKTIELTNFGKEFIKTEYMPMGKSDSFKFEIILDDIYLKTRIINCHPVKIVKNVNDTKNTNKSMEKGL